METESKDSIHRIEETGCAGERENAAGVASGRLDQRTRDAARSESEACCSKEDAATEEKRRKMKIHE